MFEAAGYRVKHLLRVRVGTLRLGDLPRGHWRLLTKRELTALAKTDNSLAPSPR
jgi:16S rRNA U516 pseudouridylate synthase RsuA-like enzyme